MDDEFLITVGCIGYMTSDEEHQGYLALVHHIFGERMKEKIIF